MFAQFFKETDFYEKYIQLYAARQAMANMQMEDMEKDLLERTQELFNNVIAFDNILTKEPQRISPYDLIDIADDINGGMYAKGFRKTQVEVKKAQNFYPPRPVEVPQAVYSVFNAYHNIWCDLPVYEKEARLHIELVRIQPFEDGNKRSTRVLTNYNLFFQNKAPVIISGKETDEYFGYIDNYDVEGMTKFLKKKSEQELQILLDLYERTYGNSFVNDSEGSAEVMDVKTMVRRKK